MAVSRAYDAPTHVDFGALSQRVHYNEQAVKAIGSDVASLRSEMSKRFDNLGADLGAKIAAQAPKGTPWLQVAGVMLTAFIVFGSFYAYTQTQAAQNSARIEAKIDAEATDRKQADRDFAFELKPVFAITAQHADDVDHVKTIDGTLQSLWDKKLSKDIFDEYVKGEDKLAKMKADYDERDRKDIAARVEGIDATIIKRQEIESAHKFIMDRIDALSARTNDDEKELHSAWSLVNTVKSMETRLENLQNFRREVDPSLGLPALATPAR
jgi:hypothetical protein